MDDGTRDERHRATLSRRRRVPTGDVSRPRLARLLPWVLPPADMSGGDQGRAFIATVIEDARRNVENRRVGLDGSTLALLAACFSRGDDLDDSSSASPRSLTCASCAPLVDAFRAISKREAADAAARAAAARFGGDASANDAMETDAGAADAGIAALTRAIVRRCAADLDARDWGAVVGRLDAWTSTRAKTAETRAANEDDVDDSDDGGAAAMRDARRRRVSSTVYPWKSPNPRPRRRPVTSSRTPRAVTRRGRSRPRSLRRRGRASASTSSNARSRARPRRRRAQRYRRGKRRRETTRVLDARAARDAHVGTNRAHRVWDGADERERVSRGERVDAREDAPFETVTSLYQLFHARGVSSDDDDVRDALRRAAYGLLSSDALVQAAVVGLDASIADVDKVERAPTPASPPRTPTTRQTCPISAPPPRAPVCAKISPRSSPPPAPRSRRSTPSRSDGRCSSGTSSASRRIRRVESD